MRSSFSRKRFLSQSTSLHGQSKQEVLFPSCLYKYNYTAMINDDDSTFFGIHEMSEINPASVP